jgi:hypothetical protein
MFKLAVKGNETAQELLSVAERTSPFLKNSQIGKGMTK